MGAQEGKSVRRSLLRGLLLRPFGLSAWQATRSGEVLSFSGASLKSVRFADIGGVAELKRTAGLATIRLPLKDQSEIKLTGVSFAEAAEFVSDTNDAILGYFTEKFEEHQSELQTLSDAMSRLNAPRRYPAACLLNPFRERARNALLPLIETVPEGILSAEQRALLDDAMALRRTSEGDRQAAIARFVEAELDEMKPFFETIESHPLTPEQRLAVVSDEDATLVLAGAGSGKTSVIVSKAAYLIEREIRAPNQILLMAFGRGAADEMADRIEERSGAKVDALTFHALGNKIIGAVEGGKPALAAHATDDAQLSVLLRDILINDVAKVPGLRDLIIRWFSDFYRPYKSEWDFSTKCEYYRYVDDQEFRTLQGEEVKSFEELQIANWLYRNGIAYEYEPDYEVNIPLEGRRAYTPDFRLTESGVYLEHFGVRKVRGEDGVELMPAPHVDREKYLESMAWKRRTHKENGTTLIETFSYERVEGRLLTALADKVAPYAEPKPRDPEALYNDLFEMGQTDAFTQTLGTFLKHFKSSGASIEDCRERGEQFGDKQRNRAFLKIFEPVFEAYQKRLEKRIDFEDMILRAAKHVETGRYRSPYRHILVDEFQDISEGRARLLKALKAQYADARLFAVGDDWQSIFRFAGSDIHLMRDFGKEFGGEFAGADRVHAVVDLGRTFRSVDKIAHPARKFVLRNPSQIEKTVKTLSSTEQRSIKVALYEPYEDQLALSGVLQQINASASGEASVLLLGRYGFQKPDRLDLLEKEFSNLSLRFMTVHASKGLEADHVVVLQMNSGRLGFPSEITDDPLLDLVLPVPENFEHAEERRLFYVALTRARETVTLLADREKPSAFVRELMSDPEYETANSGHVNGAIPECYACGGRMLLRRSKSGQSYFACEHKRLCGATARACVACGLDIPKKSASGASYDCSCGATYPACPKCDTGWLVEREGRYGKFLGCVNFPTCDGKKSLTQTTK